jgi:hypothetical protein
MRVWVAHRPVATRRLLPCLLTRRGLPVALGSDGLEGQKIPGERRLPGEVGEVDDSHAALDIVAVDIAARKTEFCHPSVVELVHPCSAHLRQLTGGQAGGSARYQGALDLDRDNDVPARQQHGIDAGHPDPVVCRSGDPPRGPRSTSMTDSTTCPVTPAIAARSRLVRPPGPERQPGAKNRSRTVSASRRETITLSASGKAAHRRSGGGVSDPINLQDRSKPTAEVTLARSPARGPAVRQRRYDPCRGDRTSKL